MQWQFHVAVFGSLAAVIGMIVGGIYLGGGWGAVIGSVGIIGAVAWLVAVFHIASALNSDI